MKRLILIVFLLLIATPAHPFGAAIMAAASAGGAAAFSYCTDGTHDDTNTVVLACESFNGASDCGNDAGAAANCNRTWVVNETGNNFALFATTGETPCAGRGTYVLKLVDDEAGSTLRAYTDLASAQNTIYVQVYFKLLNDLSANTKIALVIHADTGTAFTNVSFQAQFVRVSAGNYKLRIYWYNGSGWVSVDSTKVNFQLNTWYGVRVKYINNQADPNVGIEAWYQDDITSSTWTPWTANTPILTNPWTPNRAPRYILVEGGIGDDQVADIEFAGFKVSASTFSANLCP